ncbi:hypothetical protein B0T10DRAFT_602109 [Thelonectria olida]|uniref:Uncharacterized protein n=1 Tax=Thelonectria olida TaxID=1576542 RepID=A0A9P8WE83_9HYPO|nr:hypothetical protein B0T10DRAFT_602109 [Thelonectria olida]
MTSILLRASVRTSSGLGFRLGAGRRVVQVQRRLQSSPAKNNGPKAAESQPAVSNNVGAAVASRPIWERLGPLTRMAQAYGRSQRARPYATQTWSAIAIYLVADLSAQYIGGNDYDPLRTARALCIGGAAAIPHYKWFIWLSNSFNYSSRWLSLGAKIVFSQIVFTPIFNTYFFGSQALLSGEGLSGAIQRVKDTVPATFVNSAKFWPPFTAFSFTFVPMEYRAIFAGCVAVVWQTYLSFVNRRAELMEERKANLEKAVAEVGRVVDVKLDDKLVVAAA